MRSAARLSGLIAALPDLPTDHPDLAAMEAVLQAAARFADRLVDSGAKADREGCRLLAGRVAVPAGQHRRWADFLE